MDTMERIIEIVEEEVNGMSAEAAQERVIEIAEELKIYSEGFEED